MNYVKLALQYTFAYLFLVPIMVVGIITGFVVKPIVVGYNLAEDLISDILDA